MKTWGYARSFRNEDKYDNDDQINALITAGADDVVFEYEYVNPTEKRPFQMLLDMAQPGETILAVELCRICSSAREFCHIAQAIRAKKLRLQLLDGFTINCREEPYCPETEAYMLMATALYELEESKRYRRMVPGSSGVRFESKRIGRPQTTKEDIPEVFFTYYPIYEAERITATEFARLFNVSRPTIYKYIRIVRESE